jgi:hypothetical protein
MCYWKIRSSVLHKKCILYKLSWTHNCWKKT